jgi:hypothetical protein
VKRIAIVLVVAGCAAAAACGAFTGTDNTPNDDAGATAAEGGAADGAAPSDGSVPALDGAQPSDGGMANDATPVVLALNTEYNVLDLVANQDRVIWTTVNSGNPGDPGFVLSCLKEDGGTTIDQLGAVTTGGMGSLTSDGTTAYFSFLFGEAQVQSIQSGLMPIRLDTLDPFGKLEQLAARSGTLYAESFSPDGGSTREVLVVGGSTPPVALPELDVTGVGQNPVPLAVTKNHVFIGVINTGNGIIYDCPLAGCSSWATWSFNGGGNVLSMTANDDLLIFTLGTNVVTFCRETNCGVMDGTLLSMTDTKELVQSVAAFGKDLYVETSKGNLGTCTLPGCSDYRVLVHEDKLLITSSQFGHTVFADDTNVYWAALDGTDGGTPKARIMRMAK